MLHNTNVSCKACFDTLELTPSLHLRLNVDTHTLTKKTSNISTQTAFPSRNSLLLIIMTNLQWCSRELGDS